MTCRRFGRPAAAIPVLLGVWVAGFLVPELHLALLYLAPALLLVATLLGGCYPGEATLERLAARRRARRPRAARGHKVQMPAVRTPVLGRGGLLLARALAGRAPPVLPEV